MTDRPRPTPSWRREHARKLGIASSRLTFAQRQAEPARLREPGAPSPRQVVRAIQAVRAFPDRCQELWAAGLVGHPAWMRRWRYSPPVGALGPNKPAKRRRQP